MKFSFQKFIVIWIFCFWTLVSMAGEVSIIPGTGLLQQPNSNYYHLIYQLQIESSFTLNKKSYHLRGLHLYRPDYNAAGFTEEESGQFGFLGADVWNHKNFYVIGYLGYGQMQGTTSVNDNELKTQFPDRKYQLRGGALQAELAYRLAFLHLSLSHMQFVGIVSQYEYDAKVGWPYTSYAFNMGVRL